MWRWTFKQGRCIFDHCVCYSVQPPPLRPAQGEQPPIGFLGEYFYLVQAAPTVGAQHYSPRPQKLRSSALSFCFVEPASNGTEAIARRAQCCRSADAARLAIGIHTSSQTKATSLWRGRSRRRAQPRRCASVDTKYSPQPRIFNCWSYYYYLLRLLSNSSSRLLRLLTRLSWTQCCRCHPSQKAQWYEKEHSNLNRY